MKLVLAHVVVVVVGCPLLTKKQCLTEDAVVDVPTLSQSIAIANTLFFHPAEVLKVLQVTSITNRAARALANLAEDDQSIGIMDKLSTVSELASALKGTTDCDCQETLLRALRKLCTTPSKKQILLDLNSFKVIVELLKSEKTSVASNCVRALAEFTKNCSKELAQQVQEYGGIREIVKQVSSRHSTVRHAAVLCLSHLACHSHVRVCIGEEGGIQAMHDQLQADEPGHVMSKAVEGLCYCCREAINRNRVRECGALTSLLQILSSGAHPQLHKKIVSAFTWFTYSEPCLEIMLNGGLVPSLVSYLESVISDESGCEEHDDYCCEELNMSTSDISSPTSSLTSGNSLMLSNVAVEENSEGMLEKMEGLAREMKTSHESSSRNFKRKSRMKASRSLSVSSPNVEYLAGPPGAQNLKESLDVEGIGDSRSCISEMSGCPKPHYQEDQDNNQQVQTPTPPLVLLSSTPKPDFASPGRKMKDSPSVMSNSDFVLYPWFPHRRSRGHCALSLLLRLSQMADPSEVLINKPCMQVLLDYLTMVSEPSPKCARLLYRLTANPSCFEALIVKGVPSQIHAQLCHGHHMEYPSNLPPKCQPEAETGTSSGSSNIQSEGRGNECFSQQSECKSSVDSSKKVGDQCVDTEEMDCGIDTLGNAKGEVEEDISTIHFHKDADKGLKVSSFFQDQSVNPDSRLIVVSECHCMCAGS